MSVIVDSYLLKQLKLFNSVKNYNKFEYYYLL